MININTDIIKPFSDVIKLILTDETAVTLSKAVLSGKAPSLPYSTLLPMVFMYQGTPSTSKVICSTDAQGVETCEYKSIQDINFHIRVQTYGDNALGRAIHLQTELLEPFWVDSMGDVNLTYHKGSHARETNIVEDGDWTDRAWFDAVLSVQVVKTFTANPLESIELSFDITDEEGTIHTQTLEV